MRSAYIVLILGGLLVSLSTHAETTGQQNTADVNENIANKLHLYANDNEVYASLKHQALVKAVEKLYASQLKEFPSQIYSQEIIVDKLTSTISSEDYLRSSNGSFKPCITLKKPSITELDIARFKAINIAQVCNLNKSTITEQEQSIQQSFIQYLKTSTLTSNNSLDYMINQPVIIKQKTDVPTIKQTTESVSPIKFSSQQDMGIQEISINDEVNSGK